MNELEHLVRDTLLSHDKDAPDASRLLDDVRARVSGQRRNRSIAPLATAALVIAVTAVIFVVVAPDDEPPPTAATGAPTSEPSPTGDRTSSPSPDPRPDDSGPLAGLTVHDGDAVTASGLVVQRDGGPPTLCTQQPMAALAGALLGADPSAPTCSPLRVMLDVAVQSLPGWQARDGGGFTAGAVTVDGVWRDGILVVDSADDAVMTPGDELSNTWQVPCAPPAGGWKDDSGLPADVDIGIVEAAVSTEVATHPDIYHAYWVAYPDGDPRAPGAAKNEFGEPAHVVMVVSTAEDPTVVHAHLSTMYPGNLCVTQVEHSSADLDAAARRLDVPDGSWVADAQSLYAAVANRVFLNLPVLDEAAVARIGNDAALLKVQPLLRPTS